MSKNISNLSGRIGLKNNLFEKISERSLKSNNADGIKEIAKEYNMGVSTIHGAVGAIVFVQRVSARRRSIVEILQRDDSTLHTLYRSPPLQGGPMWVALL